jgi:hypothetical protein
VKDRMASWRELWTFKGFCSHVSHVMINLQVGSSGAYLESGTSHPSPGHQNLYKIQWNGCDHQGGNWEWASF